MLRQKNYFFNNFFLQSYFFKIKKVLMKRTITQKDLAEVLGVKRSNLSELLKGKLRFGSNRAALLEQRTGIGIRTWLFGKPDEIRRELEKVYGKINFKRGRLPRKAEAEK